MRTKEEYHPNPDACSIHTDIILTDERHVGTEYGDKSKCPQFLLDIANLKGVDHAWANRYEVCIIKGKVFEWTEIIPHAKAVLETIAQIPGVRVD